MGIFDYFKKQEETETSQAVGERKDGDIFKAYIPDFLYRPPFGMPRRVNTPQLKKMSANPYIFSVIKTLCDEATSIKWEIKVKEEFQGEDYSEKLKEITKFFRNPNGNDESLNHLLRQLITDLCEVDSAVLVKVFNRGGKMKQIFSRDGSLFLKNPDIYGYLGNKVDFVSPLPNGFSGVNMNFGGTPTETQQQIMKQYSLLYKDEAAYFQYGWTAGSMPIPFGKREIVYIMQNPRSDSIYGTSPISRLINTILNLVYGIDFNLDFYTNNNMPEGAIQLLGANSGQISQWRENFENQFKFTDVLGNKRKRFFKFPISSSEVKFTPFQLNAKDMDIITQQEWFTKVLWMSFGVNADEMGFTQDSNKSVGAEQIKTFKRKAVRPLLDVIQYHLNTQIIPEFFVEDNLGDNGDKILGLPDYADVPLEFVFDTYDIDEDVKELKKFETELNMGIKTVEMVAKERGIDLVELEATRDEEDEEEYESEAERADVDRYEYEEGKEEGEETKKKEPETKALKQLLKHKYLRRTGSSGKYVYHYRDGTTSKKPKKQTIFQLADELMSKIPLKKLAKLNENFKKGMEGDDSIKANQVNGVFTPKRKKLHQSIVRDYNKSAKQAISKNPKVVFMAGLPGSGKTFATKEFFQKVPGDDKLLQDESGEKYLILNADDIKNLFPEYDGGEGASLVHQESSIMNKKLTAKYMKKGVNIIVDGTLKTSSKANKSIKEFSSAGYKTQLIYVKVPVKLSVERAMARFERTGRFVHPSFIISSAPKIEDSIKENKALTDSFVMIDNTSKPKIIDRRNF